MNIWKGKLLISSAKFQWFLRFKLSVILSRFTSQICRNNKFAYAVALISYDETFDLNQMIEASKSFISNMDLMLHEFSADTRVLDSNKLKSKLGKLERQFMSSTKVFPAFVHDRLVRNCNVNVFMNLGSFFKRFKILN